MSKFAEIKLMYFNENQAKNRVSRTLSSSTKDSRQSKLLEVVLMENINKIDDLDIDNSFDIDVYDNIKMDFDYLCSIIFSYWIRRSNISISKTKKFII